MQVSIIIKALNEERNIARAIESALAALPDGNGEVILADSGSTDHTLDIAARYPIAIVQLTRPEDRGCGTGPQLGYQYSSGDFVCLIDGDMALDRGFIAAALATFAEHAEVAGIAGFVREMNVANLEFRRRMLARTSDLDAGEVDRLSGGGIYRRSAVEAAGYLSDRNLHGHEEYDLGLRLRSSGFKLLRLDRPFVDHYGHAGDAYGLLWRRWKTRYLCGVGEVLRAAAGTPHLWTLVRELRELHLWLAVYAWVFLILGLALFAPTTAIAVAGIAFLVSLPVLTMSFRRNSLELGLYSVVAWLLHAAGTARGFFHPRIPPTQWIESRVVQHTPPKNQPRANGVDPRTSLSGMPS